MFEGTISYIEHNRNKVSLEIIRIKDKIREIENKKDEMRILIQEDSEKIDEAYDVFSPETTKNIYLEEKIKGYDKEIDRLNQEWIEERKKLEQYMEEEEKMKDCLDELRKDKLMSDESMREKPIEDTDTSTDEISCINIKKTEHISDDKEEEKRYIAVKKREIQEMLFACETALSFFEVDRNKSKNEIEKIQTILNDKLELKSIRDNTSLEKLTIREKEILVLIARGLLNKEIANELNITERTVKNHISNMFKKLNVYDRTQAAVLAIRNNLL